MNLMVNPTITDFRQDVNGDIKMLKIGVDKEDAYANIQGQATSKVENNKAATINVSTYTQPVEITPTSGKTSMKKATITLSNIPSPSGVTKLYAWGEEGSNAALQFTTNEDGSGVCIYANTSSSEEIETTTFDNTLVRKSSKDISLT